MNVRLLEQAFDAGSAEDLVSEIRDRHLHQVAGEPAYSTVSGALREHHDITGKRLTGRAYERDGPRCELWINRMNEQYTPEQLVLIDET